MKILLVHNSYQHHGGEDVVFRAENELLAAAGHHVITYTRNNQEIDGYNWLQKASLARRTVWAGDTLNQMRAIIASDRPDVAHFHNTFPLVSPSAYLGCRESGVPVVQTLHNPRLLCPAATLYRNGAVCEDCAVTKIPWPAVVHGCYRDSRLQTAVVAAMLATHRRLNTWEELVDRYIVSTNFFARKFIAAGLPVTNISVKPHFASGNHRLKISNGEYAVFVGRLAPEKGVLTLLKAWQSARSVPLKIRGDGPLFPQLHSAAIKHTLPIEWLPRMSEEDLIHVLRGARFLVWPSEGLYETFGLVAVEAFACGVPVIASDLGAMAEIVRDGEMGLHFRSGEAADLAEKVAWAWNHPAEMHAMGLAARAEYESKYTPERNYEMLMNIYGGLTTAAVGASAVHGRDLADVAIPS
ncbi:MAG TPA: glycosyltransferase family 4 protein [Candidatus Acidoferrales bacterium]